MKAIYRGRLAHVTDDTGNGVVLDGEVFVGYWDMGLILDPTDSQVEAARSGDEIPIEDAEREGIEAIVRTLPGHDPDVVMAVWDRVRKEAIQRG